ncbi:hypothetical protein D081_1399 [Anaerovibrio sp. JC8]|uniref:YcjF family protein n=1 Tax=Anaerovibrio sp. JC8 TaxID=1240085 RepID=UPI000A0A7EB0|nr:hypothetical protein [Anaerovibrio sp. JC8]ORT99818.1 hypothetical protein D081_1399 [Anaerovibrio sp. JC8]
MGDNILIPTILQSSLEQFDSLGNHVLSEEINAIVKKHAMMAMGASFIPIPGASLAALYANDLYMFKEINDCLGIRFSNSQIKTIAIAIGTELGAFWLAKKGIFEMVKFLPGFGALAGGMLRAASEAAEIYVVAIIYYHILSITKTADRETLTDDYLKKIVRECMTQRQEELKSIFLSAKSIFKKADPSAIKKAEKEIKNQMDKDTSKEYMDVVQALKDTKPSTK